MARVLRDTVAPGGIQSDIAALCAEDIDWEAKTVAFTRKKTKSPVLAHFGNKCAEILQQLPKSGPLFPMLAQWPETDRAKAFSRRCKRTGVAGVSLHSSRYSWAERAKTAGYPVRFAMVNLGHKSEAVAEVYAKKAPVSLPPLEDYERKAHQGKALQRI